MRLGERLRQARRRRHLSQSVLAEALGVSVQSISRWERDEAVPHAHLRLQLSQFFGISPAELWSDEESQEQEQVVPQVIWNVPYLRNPFFTGREDLLQTLHEQLTREHTMALTQSIAVSGLGGIGKTQIALEYAYQYQHDYTAVFWLSAASRETLLSGLVTLAELLQLPEKNEHDQQRVLRAVKQWLASHQQWLFILDNADDLTIVHDVLPTARSGHVLLTTRAQALGTRAHRLEVEIMGMAEATLFLLRRAKLLAPEAFLDQASSEHLAAAEALAIELDFLPLALDQAGAYIEEVGCSLSAYLELYRTHRKELLHRRGQMSSDHPEPVATTWSLSFEKIEQANPAAAELLRFCAFLEPDTIPEELISEGSAHLGSILGPAAADTFTLDEAIQELRKFSLVQRDAENRLLRVHRLVQAVLKDAMEAEEQRQWAERAVRATHRVFPETVEMATWPLCRRYLPQAQVCTALIQDYAFVFEEAASLLHRTACYLQDYALYEQAEALFQRAISISKQVLGPDHPKVARSLTRLADLSRVLGKHEQAESLLQQAVRIQEQALGPNHPELALSLRGLAMLYRALGKYKQGESLFQQAVRIQEQALGLEHPEVALSFNELAKLYRLQGKYEQAEPLFQQALCVWEQVWGPDHPDGALMLNNLAILYMEQGKYEQAESLFQRTLRVWEQAWGPDHPEVARASFNLAVVYYEQGKYEQVESLFQRTLRIWEQAWGPDHPDVTRPLLGLGELYRVQGKYKQAELLFQRALHIWEQTMEPNHPQAAHLLHGLANLYRVQGKYEQAEPLFQRTLHIHEQTVEPLHPYTAEMLHDFAALYEAQGQLQEAASLYQRALSIREQVFGPEHPKTIETRRRLRAVLEALGEVEEGGDCEGGVEDEVKR